MRGRATTAYFHVLLGAIPTQMVLYMRSCLCVKYLTRIQNQIRIPSQLNPAHQLQLTGRRKLFHISQLLGTDTVLTG